MILDLSIRFLLKDGRRTFRAAIQMIVPIMLFVVAANLSFSTYYMTADVPALTAVGRRSSENGFRYYNSISSDAIQNISETFADELRIVPFIYHNIQYFSVPQSFSFLYISILVVPDDFVDDVIKKHVRTGRIPNEKEPACIIGSMVARQWNLRAGDYLDCDIKDRLVFQKSNGVGLSGKKLLVAGELSNSINFQFFRGATIMSTSTFQELYGGDVSYNGLFVFPMRWTTGFNDIVRALAARDIGVMIKRVPVFRADTVSYGLLLLLVFLISAFYMNTSMYVFGNLKSIGVLRSLGFSATELSKVFILTTMMLELTAIILASSAVWSIMGLLNRSVAMGSPLPYRYLDHFRYFSGPLWTIGCAALLCAVIGAINVCRCINRATPDELIRKGQT